MPKFVFQSLVAYVFFLHKLFGGALIQLGRLLLREGKPFGQVRRAPLGWRQCVMVLGMVLPHLLSLSLSAFSSKVCNSQPLLHQVLIATPVNFSGPDPSSVVGHLDIVLSHTWPGCTIVCHVKCLKKEAGGELVRFKDAEIF